MFDKLVASEGGKTRTMSTTTLVASVLAHVVILGGIAYAAENTEVGRKVKEEVAAYIEIQPEPEPPEPPKADEPPPPPPPDEAPPPVAKGFQDLVPPLEPPPKIPDVDVSQKAVNIDDFSGLGAAGGSSKGVEGGTRQNTAEKVETASTGPIDVALAEEKPVLRNKSEIQRLLTRLYPPLLRDAGITGSAVIKFVVNAQGRVEAGSVSVVTASHESFGDASTRVGEKMQFSPAKVGGRAIPVLVTMPVTWVLER
jgi:protein TonB